ncbi:hypothetical protein SAMN05877809_103164 [Rhodobacter sp. JA431]|uniref:hypothetical protein n=1 Tax=Rhodobacter sp. JA431 TaxID=570013 RepID=UPI000BD40DDB|nr:hypothetical protein [Rhodobacter sp. JA431]SOC04251.1 hypothetical protein SAMN05877809_103164 [Rhodobacter sp. JA431]
MLHDNTTPLAAIGFEQWKPDGTRMTPVIIGLDMEKLTKRQAIEMVYALSAPIFSDSSQNYDAARMREAAELF